MNIKLKNNKDSIVNKKNTTIKLLYFKTILNNKIPNLKNSEDTKKENTTIETIMNNASIINTTPSTETNTTQTIPSNIKINIKNNQPINSKTEIIKIQKSLKALKYYHKTTNNFITRKNNSKNNTIKTIKKFQKDHQLSKNNNINTTTNLKIIKTVTTLPITPTITTPTKTATKTTSTTTTKTNKPTVKPKTVPTKSTKQIYKLYKKKILTINKKILTVSKSNPNLMIKMLNYLN